MEYFDRLKAQKESILRRQQDIRNMGNKDAPLDVSVEGDELVIRIGVSTLAFAASRTELFNPWNDDKNDWVDEWKVTDEHRFAQGVGYGMTEEEEDGSTPLTRLLDTCFLHAVEGDYGVDELGEPVLDQDRGRTAHACGCVVTLPISKCPKHG